MEQLQEQDDQDQDQEDQNDSQDDIIGLPGNTSLLA